MEEASKVPSAWPESEAPKSAPFPAPPIISHLGIISGSRVKSKLSTADLMLTLGGHYHPPNGGEQVFGRMRKRGVTVTPP